MLSANDVASVIIARHRSFVDAMSLQKLLYYVQAWHLAITDEQLFPERIKAWRDGPVVPQVWHERRDMATRVPANQDLTHIELDATTSDLIDLVLAKYASMSGEEMSILTHAEQPWLAARGELPPDADSQEPVSVESMARYYRAHGRLGGRTAADLAAGGIHPRGDQAGGAVDVDAILGGLGDEYFHSGDDPWGGGNLDPGDQYDADGIRHEPRRTYADS